MKLLSTLKNQPADNCFILTYNADLAFFEYMLFAPLYISGCRNVTILCDPFQYKRALEDISILRFVGQRYVFLPARISKKGAFHPKLIFLTGTKGGSVTVTSGNLTSSGYTHNIEVASHFHYSVREPNLTTWQACLWAYQTIEAIVGKSDAGDIAQKRLNQLYGTTPWLREAPPGIVEEHVWSFHNLNEPLLDQFMRLYEEIDHSRVKEISIVSPFFDRRLHALSAFVERLRPNRVSIYSYEPYGLDPMVLDRISKQFSLEIRFFELDCAPRPLHAKAILIRTDRGSWAVTGSANMSAPAWLHPSESGNTEIVTARYEETSEYFNPWFQELAENAYSVELEDIEYRKIEGGEIEEEVSFQIASATLEGKQLIIQGSPEQMLEGNVVTHLESGSRIEKLNTEAGQNGSELSCKVPDKLLRWLEAPARCWVEFHDDEGTTKTSNTVLLINLNSLLRFSQPITKNRGRESLQD
jgi:HKD family nuclease